MADTPGKSVQPKQPMFLLHGGLPKSGSSTLQTEMNRLALGDPERFAYDPLGTDTVKLIEAGDAGAIDALDMQIERCSTRSVTCLMSHEALVHKPLALERILEIGARHYQHRELFFLLREPAAASLSAYAQWGFRGHAVGPFLNEVLDELGTTDNAMLLTARELFCLLQLKLIDQGRRPVFPLYAEAARVINGYAADNRLQTNRISALSLDDAPRDRSLLGHCWDQLGLGGSVSGLRSEALQVNPRFHPLCVELVTRDPETGRFLKQPRYTPHNNRPVREISAVLAADERTREPVINNDFEASLLAQLAGAFSPLLETLSPDVAVGAWERYSTPGQAGRPIPWPDAVHQARDVLEQRSGTIRQRHFDQLVAAGALLSSYRFKPAAIRSWFDFN